MKSLQVDIQTGRQDDIGREEVEMDRDVNESENPVSKKPLTTAKNEMGDDQIEDHEDDKENETATDMYRKDEEEDMIDDSQSYDTITNSPTENDVSVRRNLFGSEQYDETMEKEVDYSDDKYESEDNLDVLRGTENKSKKSRQKIHEETLDDDVQTGGEEEVDVAQYIDNLDKDRKNNDIQSGSRKKTIMPRRRMEMKNDIQSGRKVEGEKTIIPRRRMEMNHQVGEEDVSIKKHKNPTDSSIVAYRKSDDIETIKEVPKDKNEKRYDQKVVSIRPSSDIANSGMEPVTVQSGRERNDVMIVRSSNKTLMEGSTPSQTPSKRTSRSRVVVHSGGSRKLCTSTSNEEGGNGVSRAELVIQNGELKKLLTDYKQKLKNALEEHERMKRMIVSLKVELTETNEKLTDARIETLGLKEHTISNQKRKSKELKFTRTSTGRLCMSPQ